MKQKKFLSFLLVAIMMVTSLALPVSAAGWIETYDCTDTTFDFSFWFGGKSNTEGRKKDTDSSVYVNCTQVPTASFELFVDGSNNKDAPGFLWTNCTWGTYEVESTGVVIIDNRVREKDFSFARLGGYRSTGSGNAKGEWSPDYC